MEERKWGFCLRQRLLFLGYRKNAIKAAKSLGLDVDIACLGGEPSPVHTYPLNIWHSESEEKLTEQIKNSFAPGDPGYVAILALTERSVPFAGRLRDQLGVLGMSESSANLCHFKNQMKDVARKNRIRVADHAVINTQTDMDLLIEKWGWPLIIKEAGLSGSRGMKFCWDRSELVEAWHVGKLVEALVRGKEMSIESLLVGGEVRFTNFTTYHRLFEMNLVPAKFSKEVSEELLDFNKRVLSAFGIQSGMTHLELFLTDEGPVFGELAVRPPGGHILCLIEKSYGFDPWKSVLQIAMGLEPDLSPWSGKYSGAWIIHPGAGKLVRIEGKDAILRMPELDKLRLKVSCGQNILPRIGSGIEIGHAIFSGDSYDQVATALDLARETLRFRVESLPG